MTPMELANKYLQPYIIRGAEIIPELCPFCHGGPHHDKKTFALNIEKRTYNCKRGSCNATGTFNQLLEYFGERKYETKTTSKNYETPKTRIKPGSSKIENYFTNRGISRATWQKYGVGDDGKGNIAMPYYENGKIVMMKFREAKIGGKKGWREPGGKPVFWGMQHCNPGEPLTIVEGEIDLLTLVEVGITNVVSIPSGAQDLTCVNLCWDWLQQFKTIVIWVDNDEPGQELQRKLIQKLGAWRCCVVNSERKDANEVLLLDGKDAVLSTWFNAVEVPQAGLIRLAEVQPFDFSKAVRVMSGFQGIDHVLGGFFMGQTTVWTGKSTAGKSTLLGQILLNAVDQGYAVCAYSGELPSPIFRYWIDLQAAGPDNVNTVYDTYRQDYVAKVPPGIAKKIRDWYHDLFYLYDSFNAPTETNLFGVFEYAARRYDCKVFMVDNLMTLMLESASEGDWWAQQRRLINRLCNFARSMNVHVHVVAHPKKVRGNNPEREDVSGVAEITNRVDNILIHKRLTESEKADYGGVDAVLTVDKNRMFGKQNQDIGLLFDNKCKRYRQPSQEQKVYGWSKDLISKPDGDEESPFCSRDGNLPKPPYGWVVKKMCKGCLRISGDYCMVQMEPYYIYRKYGECYSKITDFSTVMEIENAVMAYCHKKNFKYEPLEEVTV